MTVLSHNDLLTLARLEAENAALRERLGRAAHHARRARDRATFPGENTDRALADIYGAAEDALRALGEETCVLEDGRIRPRWLRVVPYVAGAVFVGVLIWTTPDDAGSGVTLARAGLGFIGGALVGWWAGAWR